MTSTEYAFILFVSGASDASARAIENVRELCDTELPGCHELNVVDLHQQPAMAEHHRVLATPTLVRNRPPPSRIVVGDMSDHQRILTALGVAPHTAEPSKSRAGIASRNGKP
jgi:circadian clock protein KaiB